VLRRKRPGGIRRVIDAHELRCRLPEQLAAVQSKAPAYSGKMTGLSSSRVISQRNTVAGHLAFAMRYEG